MRNNEHRNFSYSHLTFPGLRTVLLIGPTGSGKTPLGNFFKKRGFLGLRCVHFDFGANLRRIAGKRIKPSCLSVSNFAIVKNVVKLGKLLGEKDFRIARTILEEFIRHKHVRKNDVLVLNGLPRHKGQAEAVNKMIDVKLIIYLNCKVRIVRERIRKNSGGDRIGRVDDSLWFISQKLRIFKARTLPLINYYRGKGASIISINVAEDSTPASIMNVLNGDRVFLGNWLGANSGLVSNRKDRLFK